MASVITTVAGLDMHYEVFHPRAEKTIVLLHGFTGSTKTWHHVIDKLGDDVRIFARALSFAIIFVFVFNGALLLLLLLQ